MELHIASKEFFSNYIFYPFAEELTYSDKQKALINSIALGLVTLGILHLVCAIIYLNRKYALVQVSDSDTTQKLAKTFHQTFPIAPAGNLSQKIVLSEEPSVPNHKSTQDKIVAAQDLQEPSVPTHKSTPDNVVAAQDQKIPADTLQASSVPTLKGIQDHVTPHDQVDPVPRSQNFPDKLPSEPTQTPSKELLDAISPRLPSLAAIFARRNLDEMAHYFFYTGDWSALYTILQRHLKSAKIEDFHFLFLALTQAMEKVPQEAWNYQNLFGEKASRPVWDFMKSWLHDVKKLEKISKTSLLRVFEETYFGVVNQRTLGAMKVLYQAIKETDRIDFLLAFPRQHLSFCSKADCGDLFQILPDEEAVEAFELWWQQKCIRFEKSNTFPLVKMIQLTDNVSAIRSMIREELKKTEYLAPVVPHALFRALEKTPWKLVTAMRSEDYHWDIWVGIYVKGKIILNETVQQHYPKCYAILKACSRKEVEALREKLEELIKEGKWDEAKATFKRAHFLTQHFDVSGRIQFLYHLEHLSNHELLAATCNEELRNVVSRQMRREGIDKVLEVAQNWPARFVEDICNPWGAHFLDDSDADLPIQLGDKKRKIHKALANLDPSFKKCFNEEGKVKPGCEEEAELRLDWYYGKATAQQLQSDLGKKILSEHFQKPLSLAPLLNDVETADYTIRIAGESKVIKAHKFVLKAIQFFAIIFRSGYKEAKSETTIFEHSYAAVQAVIQAAYEGKLAKVAAALRAQQLDLKKERTAEEQEKENAFNFLTGWINNIN